MLEEQTKSQMIANSLTAIVDVYEQTSIHQKICDYCRDISESEMVCIAFFSENSATYTLQTLSCRTPAVQRAVAESLPLEVGREYPSPPHGFVHRGTETEAPLEFASLREFLGDSSSALDLSRPELAEIRQVISYPIVYEKTIKGALVLFRRHPSENTELFRIFAIQCSLVLKFSSQIKQLEEMRRLEGQLFQAQKMEAVGKLAGGIAHDFNNMLSGISGYANLIKRKFGAEKPELKNFATAILSASERAADLTRKLLAFARKGKYQTVHIDMHQTIHEVIQLLERTIDPRIKITQRLRASPSVILGDPTQVQNMVLNLAINARDAMPEGGDLTLETDAVALDGGTSADGRYEVEAGAYLRLAVGDTGVGMDPETRERVFEPFFTTKSVGKGTGLGLASVYGTVKSHGGFITVESRKGKGSTFTVHVPLSKLDVTPEQTAQTEEIVRGHGHIMVVDDEQMVCNLSREVLGYLGYTVHTCNDGMQAVEYFSKNPDKVDLVILDVIMPGMDGYETFKKLREVRDDVKVIVTTGYSLKEDTHQILSRGVCGFIQKPFESGKLSRLVRDVITGKAPRGGR
jgi:signal transduction histidine kinase/ActR/RegA family two-component response regulator